MAKTIGILINKEFDLAVELKKDANGLIVSGLVIGDSVYQQQTLLLIINKGEIKDRPLVGVGLNSYLLDDASTDEIIQEVTSQLTNDGMRVFEVDYTSGKLNIVAEYELNDTFK